MLAVESTSRSLSYMASRCSSSTLMDPTTLLSRSCTGVSSSFREPRTRADVLAGGVDPEMLPRVRVDRGAIKFVLAGANIMWCVAFPL